MGWFMINLNNERIIVLSHQKGQEKRSGYYFLFHGERDVLIYTVERVC